MGSEVPVPTSMPGSIRHPLVLPGVELGQDHMGGLEEPNPAPPQRIGTASKHEAVVDATS